ncbi:WD domain-containing protein [Ophiocordyceps camponoti-floridani]|uniref:Pre-rRNA-processing protein IPI3 n=1 Tax=Ophiocordyceps camponoti-floridani TaxID=2030778 RepID=A0A8H4Q5T9_9HYPO|nr:WD domain-containing protein [Ophiocordyceps camponoti-floridani]
MASELLLSSICGPQIAANTSVARDIGIHAHTVSPSWAPKASFRKSSTPPRCLAVSNSHIFAAQHQKAQVHVYSRARGNQEALVSFQEKVRCLALAGDVLVVGTVEGRLMLWETRTGRQISTPPCHVRAVSCLAASPLHLLSASDDSNVNVWSLARLLELGADVGHEPDRVLSNHRAPVTDLALGPSVSPETGFCVSASKDKSCIVWNYHSGQLLRTLLFSAAPLCIALDPCARALFVGADDGGLYLSELFINLPQSVARAHPAVVQAEAPLGVVGADAGLASCVAVSHDGTIIYTGHEKGSILRWSLADNGHPTELANINASVTNLVMAPLVPERTLCKSEHVVKPTPPQRQYVLTAQLEGYLSPEPTFGDKFRATGIDAQQMEKALVSFAASRSSVPDDSGLCKEAERLPSVDAIRGQ